MTRTPQVDEINEFLEIASDFENPLELIRESLSNAYDAHADQVNIRIEPSDQGSNIRIDDDGDGMGPDELAAFFDLGNSTKSDSIGYKGHGTKIYYKSDRIQVETVSDGTKYVAEMDRPWAKLERGELPTYTVEETTATDESTGTEIKIEGFRSGTGLAPRSLTYNRIDHYLRWWTIAGSTAHYFDDDARNMDIEVELDGEIDDAPEPLEADTKFDLPDERLEPDDSAFPTERMCKHYGPDELSVTAGDETTTVEIVGMVGGKAARNELPTYGKHSAQFGVWLAKDHINVEQISEVVPDDTEATHLFFVANCQDVQLTANRGNVRHKGSDLYEAVLEEIGHYVVKVTSDPWFENYLELRKEAKLERRARKERESLDRRAERAAERVDDAPTNKPELLVQLERSNRKTAHEPVEVAEFTSSADNVEAFTRHDGSVSATAVALSVEEFLRDERPLRNVARLVVWEWGDRDFLDERQRRDYLGGELSLSKDDAALTHTTRTGDRCTASVVIVEERLSGRE